MLLNPLPALITILLVGYAVWNLLRLVASRFHLPPWTPIVFMAAALYALVTVRLVAALISTIRKSREKRELAMMSARYPQCNVVRLQSGEWFLVDKATGREYSPTEVHDGQT